jgi:myo-inositol-1(or 4)-monophosphatase
LAKISAHDLPAVLALLTEAATEAGAIAMHYFREGTRTTAEVHAKAGGSPVTEADFAVDRFLLNRLVGALPQAGWLSEETADSAERLSRHDVLVVDPIDGTRAFVAGLTAWAISVALVSGDRPVAGVVYVPAMNRLYQGMAGGGAWCDGVPLMMPPRSVLAGARVAGPENFVAPFVRRARMTYVEKVPSLACRFVRLAEGLFEVGISSANSHDWDLAAADLILEEAGGRLTAADGRSLAYNRAVPRHPPLFGSSRELHPALLELAGAFPRA